MKTAKEILDKYLENYPWIHGGRENAIKAMMIADRSHLLIMSKNFK